MKKNYKPLIKKIGIGAIFIVPVAIGLAILFADLKMNNNLAIFLIILACSIVCFAYVLVYNKIEQNAKERRERIDDPFSKQ